jgi:hypothetical protein
LPGNCPASLRPTAIRLWKTFRSKLNTIPVDEQNCSPSHRNCVHLQTGMLFGITTEWRSASHRNRVHLRPDSPVGLREARVCGFRVVDFATMLLLFDVDRRLTTILALLELLEDALCGKGCTHQRREKKTGSGGIYSLPARSLTHFLRRPG